MTPINQRPVLTLGRHLPDVVPCLVSCVWRMQVYGAMWSPVLVAQAAQLGLGSRGNPDDTVLAHAKSVFQREWAKSA